MEPKSPEFLKTRKETRGKLKEFLPADLQLVYGQSIKPTKWNFDGGLVEKRDSEESADEIFFEALKNVHSENSLDIEDLLSEKAKESRIKLGESLESTKKVIEKVRQITDEYKKGKDLENANLFTALLVQLGELDINDCREDLQKEFSKLSQKNDKTNETRKAFEFFSFNKPVELGIISKKDYQDTIDDFEKSGNSVIEYVDFRLLEKEGLDKYLELLLKKNDYVYYKLLMDQGLEVVGEQRLHKILKTSIENDHWYAGDLFNKMHSLGIATAEEYSIFKERLLLTLKTQEEKKEWKSYANTISDLKEIGATDFNESPDFKGGFLEALEKQKLNTDRIPYEYNWMLIPGFKSGAIEKERLLEDLELVYEAEKKGNYTHIYAELFVDILKLEILTEDEKQKHFDRVYNEATRNGTFYLTGFIRHALSVVNLEKRFLERALEIYTNGSLHNDYHRYNAVLEMERLGYIAPHSKILNKIETRVQSKPKEDKDFVLQNIIQKLKQGDTLLDYESSKGPYAIFQATVKTINELNEKETDPTKKVGDVNIWIQKQSKIIADLFAIDPSQFSALLRERMADGGVPAISGAMFVYAPVASDIKMSNMVRNAITQGHFRHPHELGQFMEIARAYQKGNNQSIFENICKESSKGEINEVASKKLLTITAESVGVNPNTILEIDISKWKTQYLPNLSSNNEIMKARGDAGDYGYRHAQDLYEGILKATFESKFNEFITNTNQEDEIGKEVATHNEKVREEFNKLGISFEAWNEYKKTQDFLVSTEIAIDATERNRQLLQTRSEKVAETLLPLKDKMTPREYEPLTHILEGSGNKKKLGDVPKDEVIKLLNNLEDRLRMLQTKSDYAAFPEWDQVNEHMVHLREAVDVITIEDQKENVTAEKSFRIKTWDRDPRKDFFQGNYTQCCIAVGIKSVPEEGGFTTHDPSTVMHYLADQGIQVVEIFDQSRENPIGNAWLFVSRNNYGEPIIVVDNVEIHKDYTKDVHVNNAIRDNLFSFLSEFAKDTKVAGVGLGKVGTNDISYSSLPVMKVPAVDKVGGYLKKYTSTKTREGRYYLEAYNHTELAKIYEENTEGKVEKIIEQPITNGYFIVQNLDNDTEVLPYTPTLLQEIRNGNRADLFNESNIQDVQNIEQGAFGNIAAGREYILNNLQNTRGIQALFKEKGAIVGYMSSKPADEFTPWTQHDMYDSSSTTLYLESMGGKIDPYETLRLVKQKAREAGYKKISMHGLNPRLNKILIRYGFEFIEDVPNYLGKTAGYMEINLE